MSDFHTAKLYTSKDLDKFQIEDPGINIINENNAILYSLRDNDYTKSLMKLLK